MRLLRLTFKTAVHYRRNGAGSLALFLLIALLATPADSEELLSYAEEERTVMTFRVPDAALRPLLPDGWQSEPATSGIHEGANVFLVLADQRFIRDVRGRTVENTLAAVWLAPARGSETEYGFLVLGGYVDPDAAPGVYGVYGPAALTLTRSSGVEDVQTGVASEHWEVSGQDGGTLRVSLVHETGPIRRAQEKTHTYSARDPDVQRLYRYNQQVLPLLSRPHSKDSVREMDLTIEGGELENLIEGSDQLVSVLLIPWTEIRAYLP